MGPGRGGGGVLGIVCHNSRVLGPVEPVTVVTLLAGTKYGPEYVDRLRQAVEIHLTLPHRFLCLTDRPRELACATLPIPLDLPGYWGKVALFGDVLRGRILFLDLDTVIVGNIDDFARYAGALAVIKPFYRDSGFASGLMGIGEGAHPEVWRRFSENPSAAIEYTRALAVPKWNCGDQRWLELNVPAADYWQDLLPGQLVSYKVHCMDGVPDGARVVVFHGKPDPHEVDEPWLRDAWRRS